MIHQFIFHSSWRGVFAQLQMIECIIFIVLSLQLGLVTCCDLSATILMKIFDSYRIALTFTRWPDMITKNWPDKSNGVNKPSLSWHQAFFFGDVGWWWSGFFKVKCAAGFLIEINFQLENVVVQVPCNAFSIHFVANIWFSSTISLSRLNGIINDVITKPYEQP